MILDGRAYRQDTIGVQRQTSFTPQNLDGFLPKRPYLFPIHRVVFHHKGHKDHKGNCRNVIELFLFFVVFVVSLGGRKVG